MIRRRRVSPIFLKRLGFLVGLLAATAAVADTEFPTAEIRVISRALHFIDKNYVDSQAVDARAMLREATGTLERNMAPLVIRNYEKRLDVSWGEKKASVDLSNPLRLGDLPPVLRKLLGFLQVTYQGKLDEKEREHLVLAGMVEALDPHSNFLSPKVFEEFRIGTKGHFGGLGIVIGIREGFLTVIAPLEGTPAFRAGIRAKDRIVQIGEEATINLSLTEAVERLRGPVGSKVALVVHREGRGEPIPFTLTRDLIQIQSVGGTMVEGTRIGLLKIKNFQEDTLREVERQIESFRKKGPLSGLILDLRNNPGGLLDQAVKLGDRFLASGVIVKTVGSGGQEVEVEKATEGSPDEKLPIVVLVNEGSASASEIIAGAFQYNNRAVILGNRTFGKGSVQTVYDLKDGSALKLTVAKYLAGGNHEVQSVGITPDLRLLPAVVDPKRVDIQEDIKRRESDLEEKGRPKDNHKKEIPPSPFELRYLAPTPEEEEERSAGVEPEQDLPVRLAAALLQMPESLAADREKALSALRPLVERFRALEEEKIVEALKTINIDWSVGEERGRPKASVRMELVDEAGRLLDHLEAGSSGILKVTVENRGNGSFYRLGGTTESEDPLFSNIEFPIGRLDPGQRREWESTVKIPEMISPRSEPVRVVFQEARGRVPEPARFLLRVEEPAEAQFRYSYEVADGGLPETSGNRNGRVDPGEKVGVKIKVVNAGKGASGKAVLNLKSLGGEEVFVEKGRSDLGSIAPGESQESLLIFRVAKREVSELSFDLSIHDTRFGWEVGDEIKFPIGGVPVPPPGSLQAPPTVTLLPSPPLRSDREHYLLKGEVTDDQEVRHLTIFLDNEKASYFAPKKSGEKSLPFQADLRLKKGINRITLKAQDNRELTTGRQWIVWRD